MRVLVATDAWHPQVNGVVRSLEHMAGQAAHFGAEVRFLTPQDFRSVPLPTYGEIRLSLATARAVARHMAAAGPAHVHIATEGPIGWAARRVCLDQGRPFTTSYHTRFPEYVSARIPIPEAWSYRVLRHFHNAAAATLVSTQSLDAELRQRGFRHLARWTRGVDTNLFRPRPGKDVLQAASPIFLYVGRVSVEKNLEAFLTLDLPGTKVIVGDGPARLDLEARYPDVHFLGALTGEALARVYAAADVFAFPSLTDTFGIVLLEALASGLPVAAFPVAAPRDVLGESGCGVLDRDLRAACLQALAIPRARCRAYGETFTWRDSARQFFGAIERAQRGGAASTELALA